MCICYVRSIVCLFGGLPVYLAYLCSSVCLCVWLCGCLRDRLRICLFACSFDRLCASVCKRAFV